MSMWGNENRVRASGLLTVALATGVMTGLALQATPAGASGFQLKEQSAEGLGNAFAGATAKAYDPSTAFWNPAGMTRLSGNHASMTMSYISPSSRFSGSASTAFGTPVGGSSGGDAAKDAFVPATYGVISLSDDLKLGLAVNVPFGLSTEYPLDWVGRYQALESHLHITSVTPTVAYRVTDNLSVGGGPVFQYATVTLTSAINNLGLLPYDGQGKVSGDDLGFGFALGALWEFNERTRIGVNYRSRVHHTFDGTSSYVDVHPVLAAAGGLVNSDASADLTTPDIASVGVYHEFNDQWAAVADVAWTNWSLFEELKVDADVGADSLTVEDWHDTVFASVGGIYRPNEHWTFRAGVAYDMSPVPDKHRTARIPGEDRYWLATGASYQVADWLELDVGFTHIFVNDSTINETTSQGNLRGTYENDINIVSIGGSIRF
ncbi:OmpP1/FadL family transporter [Roseospira visakhapatnamensis]|uniref:Long-chain fatty acid transport protein n=1 Tax=Roseospira visakhapatnamensis TaxID=390880 RepID=A0A7W6RD91_9PROT|nr:outer membrane protein transport protein [Roseospira visakhapatnamensis]MBB4266348.1 long-chain fatty acid transport protein [Roseospira visakhapatnamensis]